MPDTRTKRLPFVGVSRDETLKLRHNCVWMLIYERGQFLSCNSYLVGIASNLAKLLHFKSRTQSLVFIVLGSAAAGHRFAEFRGAEIAP